MQASKNAPRCNDNEKIREEFFVFSTKFIRNKEGTNVVDKRVAVCRQWSNLRFEEVNNMSLKIKLTSTILAFCLILGLLVMGVFATSQATVKLGGSISFTAKNVYAKVSAEITNSKSDPEIEPITFNNETTDEEATETWTNPLSFKDTGDTITISLTIENLASDRPLYATLYDSIGEVDNLTKTKSYDGETYFNSQITVEAKTSETITLTLGVTDLNTSVDASYGYGVELSNDPFEALAMTDGLVTMGTYEETPVQWKLVAVDDVPYTGTSVPVSGKGIFVQETVTVSQAFDADSNDYSTSDIKTYLDGYASVLGITDLSADAVGSKIQAREMTDLYKKMGWNCYNAEGNPQDAPAHDIEKDGLTGSQNFWLMSVEELYKYVGKGTIENNVIPYDWSSVKSNTVWGESFYWLRSPSPSYSYHTFLIDIMGGCGSNDKTTTYAVRAAFNLNF